MISLFFQRLPRPVLLAGASLLPLFREHFHGWPFQETRNSAPGQTFLYAGKHGTSFTLDTETDGTESYATAAELLCDVGIELAEEFINLSHAAAGTSAVQEAQDLTAVPARPFQCLHCSAVELGSRLLVFPNVNRAGKSLLAASFLPYGIRIFADDLLAITPEGHGMSFGLPPRLRLPLPRSSTQLASLLETLPGLHDKRYRFLYSWDSLASFGDTCPLGAMVLPRRCRGTKPRLRRISPSDGLQCLAYQFQMRPGQAEHILMLARDLCERLPWWLLEYDSAEEAANTLVREAERLYTPDVPPETSLPSYFDESDRVSSRGSRSEVAPSPSDRRKHFSDLRPHQRYIRASGVLEVEDSGRLYLITESRNDIFFLDATGRALWLLLQEAISPEEAADIFHELFPDRTHKSLVRDCLRFFSALSLKKLIRQL